MTWKPDICIYHSPCDDGFAAAWVIRGHWPDVVLAPTNYGLPLPDVNYSGNNILVVDFSFKPQIVGEFFSRFGARSLVMLDHHKTAEADLASFKVAPTGGILRADAIEGMMGELHDIDRPPVVAHFDMDKSGAALAWEFCYGREIMPMLLQHVQDRDLWRFGLIDTRAVSLLLRSYPYDFQTWTDLAHRLDSLGEDRRVMIAEARAIERFYDQKLAEMLPTATLKNIGKWKDVPTAHAPYAFASDLANELLKKYPAAPFAAVVVDSYGGRTYSLRSDDSREDVSEVAKTFGGGGHRNAAGFRVPT